MYAIHGKTKAERSLALDDNNELVAADNKAVDAPRLMVLFNPTLLRATKLLVPPDPRHRLMVRKRSSGTSAMNEEANVHLRSTCTCTNNGDRENWTCPPSTSSGTGCTRPSRIDTAGSWRMWVIT